MTTTSKTVAALKDSGFYLARELLSNSAEAIEALNYIDFLSQLNAVDVGSMELPIEGNRFTLTKSDVTKLFFSHIEKKEVIEESAAKAVPIGAGVLESMRNAAAANRDAQRRTQMRNVRDRRRNAASYYQQAEQELNQAAEEYRRIHSVMDTDPAKFVDELAAGLAKTNWDYDSYENYQGRLVFVSRNDIILREVNPAAGTNYEINCGKFKLTVRTSNMGISVVGHKGHVTDEDVEPGSGNDSCIHPNISGGGVCWGSAVQTIEEAKLAGNVLKILQVLDALLPNYGTPPYVTIDEFKQDADRRDERLRREREQEEKKPEVAEGEFGDEEFFEPDYSDEDLWAPTEFTDTDTGGASNVDNAAT